MEWWINDYDFSDHNLKRLIDDIWETNRSKVFFCDEGQGFPACWMETTLVHLFVNRGIIGIAHYKAVVGNWAITGIILTDPTNFVPIVLSLRILSPQSYVIPR